MQPLSLQEMGNCIIQIDGYSVFSNTTNSYVYFYLETEYGGAKESSNAYKFENGYLLHCHFLDDNCNINRKTYQAESYNIVNNDIFEVLGDGTCIISEKKTVNVNFICLIEKRSSGDRWYVPYSIIDWSRPVETFEKETKNGTTSIAYKLYIK